MSATVSQKGDSAEFLSPPVTVCVLCYGDHPDLARRILGSLRSFTEERAMRLRLGLNAVSDRTRAVVYELIAELEPEVLVDSKANLFKLPMMRRLFYDQPLATPWTIWFDDDSYVYRSDWLTTLFWHSQLRPDVDMWGKRLFVRVDKECRSFVREASWFRGLELTPDPQEGMYRMDFIAGGFWAIRTRCLHRVGWPEARLLHFGDDYMLGEALRQNGQIMGQCFSGVAIDRAVRRAPSDTPRCHVLH
jgi:GT2 family glycosyltransferase